MLRPKYIYLYIFYFICLCHRNVNTVEAIRPKHFCGNSYYPRGDMVYDGGTCKSLHEKNVDIYFFENASILTKKNPQNLILVEKDGY